MIIRYILYIFNAMEFMLYTHLQHHNDTIIKTQ